jgi:LEA14-like dessication related protein
MKKITVKTVWFVLAFSAVLAFTNCKSLDLVLREPKFSLHSVELVGINFTGAQLLCKVNVENPNSFDIPFPEIDWNFFINTNSFVKGVVKNNESIRSRRTTVVDIPLSVDYIDIFSAFASLIGSKNINYKIALDAKFTFADFVNKVLHLEYDGNFPILQVPAVSFKGIDVKNMSLTKMDFELNLEIDNKNTIAMIVNNLSYVFSVNNSQWADGSVQNTRIAADGKTVIPISFSINSLNMVKDITQIVTRGTDISYAFTGNLRLGADLPAFKDIGNSINVRGTAKLRR